MVCYGDLKRDQIRLLLLVIIMGLLAMILLAIIVGVLGLRRLLTPLPRNLRVRLSRLVNRLFAPLLTKLVVPLTVDLSLVLRLVIVPPTLLKTFTWFFSLCLGVSSFLSVGLMSV